jgi:predicted alpha/beta-hydrolase family hydrolase
MLAARQAVRALVLLSYPLHRPGKYDEQRTDHWPDISCPVLMLSGDRDTFARIELLREAVSGFANIKLITYPGEKHGLRGVIPQASAEIASFLRTQGIATHLKSK